MTARMRRVMEVEMPVRSVFENPTIAGLAREVEQGRALGLKARTPILQRTQHPSDPSREMLLAQNWLHPRPRLGGPQDSPSGGGLFAAT